MQFLFADHILDPDRRELRRGCEPIAVEPQVFDLLIHLIRNRDRVVSKDDLIASVWDGWIVSESTLTNRINAARKAISAIYMGIAAYAQFVGRHYTEAMRLAREAISQRGDFVGAHRVLTAAAGMAEHTNVAAVALRELRRVQPDISFGWIASEMPIMQGGELQHYLGAFRRARSKITLA